MKITQITPGRFHHFHLARQMEKHGILEKIYTGYPRFKLRDEHGIPPEKIVTFPWIQTPFMKRGVVGLDKIDALNKNWVWFAAQTLDRYVAKKIRTKGVLVALSSAGLISGKKMQALGGKYICDRGSSHIEFQNDILREEYHRWGFRWKEIDKRIIDKELEEYERADFITIPSEFARQTFVDKGIDKHKIVKLPYGARLERFKKYSEPARDTFSVLWVGAISLRKGFMYALEAFEKFPHPKKEFVVIGSMSAEIKQLLKKNSLDNVVFKGSVPNEQLTAYYNHATVFILPSIEDGFGMVMAEAMACGCPVIASVNTGSRDLISHGEDGVIVPVGDVEAILNSFTMIAETPFLREKLGNNALIKVQSFGGWNDYGDGYKRLIEQVV